MYLLQNAHILTPDISAARHLLIGGGRILWIGENPADLAAMEKSPAFEVIDLEDRWLVPGLVDCHAHITGGGGESGFSSQVPAPLLSRYTSAGVTSVIGLLGTDDLTRNTSALLARTRALNEEGISAWCYTGGYHLPLTTLTGSARSDIVHIDPVIGVGEFALSDHRSSQPTLDELLRVASEVHVAGLMSGKAGVLHLHMGDGERGLELVRQAIAGSELPARVFHPTHVNRRRELFAEALQLVELGCTIDVTAFPVGENEA
ncbi:MAG: beta-aspartyl-peptidase, partial [Gammaproteobacteria bacterium]|nr:beta-aspartyl-peptidase [Gammaproteobacteria bacterium]